MVMVPFDIGAIGAPSVMGQLMPIFAMISNNGAGTSRVLPILKV
jgi:hypothetical protein